MQLTTSVEERLTKVETELKNLKAYLMHDTKSDIEKLEDKIESLEERNDVKFAEITNQIKSQFRWIIFIFLMFFATTVTLIVGLH